MWSHGGVRLNFLLEGTQNHTHHKVLSTTEFCGLATGVPSGRCDMILGGGFNPFGMNNKKTSK